MPVRSGSRPHITIGPGPDLRRSDVVALYEAAGWSGYTRDPATLEEALENSTYVAAARDGDTVVGLARCISDDVSVLYIQDILVLPDHRRLGLGRALVLDCLTRFSHVRQKLLLTDDRPDQLSFYESLGFRNTKDLEVTRLNAFVIIEGAELS